MSDSFASVPAKRELLREKIIAALRHGPRSQDELANELGYSKRHIRRVLQDLPVESTRDGRTPLYSITTTDQPASPSFESESNDFCPQCPGSGAECPGNHIDSADSGHSEGKIKSLGAGIGEQPATGHGKSTDQACRYCPYSLATLERDAIQFVLVDQLFSEVLVEQAKEKKWAIREIHGQKWISHTNLTLQVCGDTTIFYSDEPKDLSPIVNWVKGEFNGKYPNIESLLGRIRHPHRITRDELTVVVEDPAVIDAIHSIVCMWMHQSKTLYLKAPNPHTPGFKVYRSNHTLRCEFDARNSFQMISAIEMRQRFLTILKDLPATPGLLWEFITSNYNPSENPIVIDTGLEFITQHYVDMTEMVIRHFTEFAKEYGTVNRSQLSTGLKAPDSSQCQSDGKGNRAAIKALVNEIRTLEGFDLSEIIQLFAHHLTIGSSSTHVFLAAFAVWASKKCKGQVILEEVCKSLAQMGSPMDLNQVADAIEKLKKVGLLENHEIYEVYFTPQGTALGKSIVTLWEGF